MPVRSIDDRQSNRTGGETDQALVIALVCGATIENAARQAGINEAEARRTLRGREFQSRLRNARADMVDRAAALLTAAAVEAVRTLLDLQATSQPAAVRLGAARAILELGSELRSAADLANRLRDD